MADTKISAETAAAALAGTEEIPGVQSAANVKITAAQIRTYATMRSFTVSALPSAATEGAGARIFCTDLSGATYTFGATAAGGGSRNGPLWSDGTNWREG